MRWPPSVVVAGRRASLGRGRRRPAQHLLDRRAEQARGRLAATSSWSGRSISARRPPAMALRVVSDPAANSREKNEYSSTSESGGRVDVVERGVDDRREHVVGRARPASPRSGPRRTRTCPPGTCHRRLSARGNRPPGCRSRRSRHGRGRGGPPRARRAGCRWPASGARTATSTRKSNGDAVLDLRRAARRVRRRSSSSRRATIRGVSPVVTSRRIRAWRGSSIMFRTIPATSRSWRSVPPCSRSPPRSDE